jgi:hypothetical protein
MIERGFYKGTLMIEPIMHGALSVLNLGYFKDLLNTDSVGSSTESLLTEAKYEGRNESPFKGNKTKKILILGDFLAGSGAHPSDAPFARVISNGLNLPSDILDFVIASVSLTDTEVVFQPHPSDDSDYSKFATRGIKIVRRLDVTTLIKACDILCTGTSTAQFLALILAKPIILFGNSQLRNCDFVLKASTQKETAEAIKACENVSWTQDRTALGKQYAYGILSTFLYNAQTEAGARPFHDFAALTISIANMGAHRVLTNPTPNLVQPYADPIKRAQLLQNQLGILEQDFRILSEEARQLNLFLKDFFGTSNLSRLHKIRCFIRPFGLVLFRFPLYLLRLLRSLYGIARIRS